MAKIQQSQRPPFAVNISKRRKALNMSQFDLASKVGVHRNTIADIERGVSEGQPDTRSAIASVLGCTVGELFGSQPASGPPAASAMVEVIASQQQEIEQLKARLAALQLSEEEAGLLTGFRRASEEMRAILIGLSAERGKEKETFSNAIRAVLGQIQQQRDAAAQGKEYLSESHQKHPRKRRQSE